MKQLFLAIVTVFVGTQSHAFGRSIVRINDESGIRYSIEHVSMACMQVANLHWEYRQARWSALEGRLKGEISLKDTKRLNCVDFCMGRGEEFLTTFIGSCEDAFGEIDEISLDDVMKRVIMGGERSGVTEGAETVDDYEEFLPSDFGSFDLGQPGFNF